MSIATPESFTRGQDNNGPVVYIGNQRFPVTDHIKFCNEKISELSERLGRPVTTREIQMGCCDIEDTRTTERKHYDSDWRPKLSRQVSNIERLRNETEARLRGTDYGGNRDENILQDLNAMIERESQEQVDEDERAAFLEKNAARIGKLDTLIDSENWNPEGTWEMRTKLRQCREQVMTEGGCKVELEKLTRSVEHILTERAESKQRQLTLQRTLLDQKMAALEASEQVSITESAESPAA